MEKKLNYITVRYSCSEHLAEKIYQKFDNKENENAFVCINNLSVDNLFTNFEWYYKPVFKKLIFINIQNIRNIYNVQIFNNWQIVAGMFDEIYDLFESNLNEYRPTITANKKLFCSDSFDDNDKKEINELYNNVINTDKRGVIKSNCNLIVEDHCRGYFNFIPFIGGNNIYLKRFVSIGGGTVFRINTEHNYKKITTSLLESYLSSSINIKELNFKGDIVVGNDVWIGSDAVILSNVHIGDGAVIGSSAVIAKDVPPYAIVVGNPGKVIKYRFNKRQIKKLLKIKWWNWPLWKIYDNMDLINSENIDEFIKKFYKK